MAGRARGCAGGGDHRRIAEGGALWRKMGDPNTGDAATLEQMRACIRVALYTHLAIAAALIGLAARV